MSAALRRARLVLEAADRQVDRFFDWLRDWLPDLRR